LLAPAVPGCKGLREPPALPVNPARTGLPANAEKLVPPGLREPPAPPVKLVPRDRREYRDLRDNPDNR